MVWTKKFLPETQSHSRHCPFFMSTCSNKCFCMSHWESFFTPQIVQYLVWSWINHEYAISGTIFDSSCLLLVVIACLPVHQSKVFCVLQIIQLIWTLLRILYILVMVLNYSFLLGWFGFLCLSFIILVLGISDFQFFEFLSSTERCLFIVSKRGLLSIEEIFFRSLLHSDNLSYTQARAQAPIIDLFCIGYI